MWQLIPFSHIQTEYVNWSDPISKMNRETILKRKNEFVIKLELPIWFQKDSFSISVDMHSHTVREWEEESELRNFLHHLSVLGVFWMLRDIVKLLF